VISPCAYLDPLSLLSYLFSPVQLRKGVTERLWWVPGIQPGSDHRSRHG